jgi:transposase
MRLKKVELFENIRKDYFVHKKSIREIARCHGIHRRQVRQAISSAIPPFRKASVRSGTVLTPLFKQKINEWLEEDLSAPRKQRHTGRRVYERLVELHAYQGSEVTVRSYVYQNRKESGASTKVYVPQIYLPGMEAEVDWYEAMVDFPSGRTKIYIFQMRSCYSGREFHMAFSRQNQQAFLEGHAMAFNYFGGVFKTVRYDNLTSAIKKVLKGRKRIETERFVTMRSHYLFTSNFCLPGLQGAHEKGGVECGVGRFRRSHFVPVPKISGLEELNQQLLNFCQKDDQRTIIGKANSIIKDWNDEVPQLAALPIEAFSAMDVVIARVNNKSLVTVNCNHYSVPVFYVGQNVEAHVHTETVTIIKQSKIIAEHRRNYGHHKMVVELAHYLSLLRHKPGGLSGSLALKQARDNGKWTNVFEKYWQGLIAKYGTSDANRQLVHLLWWARDFELTQVERLIATAMEIGCYQLESIQSLMRQQMNNAEPAVPLSDELLGELTRYNRPKNGIEQYDLLLGARL